MSDFVPTHEPGSDLFRLVLECLSVRRCIVFFADLSSVSGKDGNQVSGVTRRIAVDAARIDVERSLNPRELLDTLFHEAAHARYHLPAYEITPNVHLSDVDDDEPKPQNFPEIEPAVFRGLLAARNKIIDRREREANRFSRKLRGYIHKHVGRQAPLERKLEFLLKQYSDNPDFLSEVDL